VGTSRNDRSPATPPWTIALAVLGAPEVPAERQCAEIWRAAVADRGERMFSNFSSESIAEACRLASAGLPPQEAIAIFNERTRYETQAGLVTDMARRAIARCAAKEGSATEFAAELFSEAVSYYASRDLASYVAAPGRVADSTSAIKLKDSLRNTTKEWVRSVGRPGLGPRQWARYVSRVLTRLQASGERK
jgi:hypothetical protein